MTPPLEYLGGGVQHIPLAQPLPTPPPATNQTKIPYPKPLKHLNKSKLRLNEIKTNSLQIYFLFIKTHFSLLKTRILICIKI